MQIVDGKTGKGHQGGGDNLGDKLDAGAEAKQVVDDAHDIDDEQAEEEDYRPQVERYALLQCWVAVQGGYSHEGSYHHAWNEGNASKPGDEVMVQLAAVGDIIEPLGFAEVESKRYEQETAEYTDNKCTYVE